MDIQDKAYAKEVAGLIRSRVKLSTEIPSLSGYFFTEEYEYDEKAVRKKLQKEGVREILDQVAETLQSLETFDEAGTDKALHDFIEQTDLGFGAVMAPLRIALCGVQSGPELFPMLEILGRDRVLARIRATQERFLGQSV